MNTKHLLIAVLLTFCLTATLFRILPTSSTSTTSTVEYEYDPWYDLNDDGDINLYDLTIIGTYYDTSGTPINKTELLLSLNATVAQLEAKLNAEVGKIFVPYSQNGTICSARNGDYVL